MVTLIFRTRRLARCNMNLPAFAGSSSKVLLRFPQAACVHAIAQSRSKGGFGMKADRARGNAAVLAVDAERHLSVLIVSEVRLLGEGLAEAFDRDGGLSVSGYCAVTYRSADYWLIPARVATGDVIWPSDTWADSQGNLVTGPAAKPLDGVTHQYVSLATVSPDGNGTIGTGQTASCGAD